MSLIEKFPVTDVGTANESPEVMPLDWEFRLRGGREIFLTQIQQHRTYGGMLCGLPDEPERTVAEAIAGAQKWDRNFHGLPIVIPSTIVRGIKSEPKVARFNLYGPTAWSILPQVTTFCDFRLDDHSARP